MELGAGERLLDVGSDFERGRAGEYWNFFFQAEDGIRDLTVTGVQTCALPISGCLVVGSRTPPVEEVIRHGENGLLTDFFSGEQIAASIDEALSRDHGELRAAARRTVVERFDLKRVCLPAQLELVARLQEQLDRGQGGVGVQNVDALQPDAQPAAVPHEGVPGSRRVAL